MGSRDVSIKIAPMNPGDMDEVEKIERLCFEVPWSREELEQARKKRYNLSKVALVAPRDSSRRTIAGLMFVEQDRFRFTVLSIAVHEKWQRHSIGTTFLEYLIKRLRQNGRHEIYELVRETNLRAQKFYKSLGFVAQRPQRHAFCETDEDAYPMIYKWEWSPQGRKANGQPSSCSKRDHLCMDCGECGTPERLPG